MKAEFSISLLFSSCLASSMSVDKDILYKELFAISGSSVASAIGGRDWSLKNVLLN